MHVVASLIVFFFLLFFVLRDGPALVEAVRRFTPLRERSKDRLLALVGRRTRAIVLGTFLVSVLQGVASGIGWWVFGFPAPFFWGFVITLVAVLPFGAPFLILVPASILAIVQGDLWQGIGLLAYSIVVVGLIDDLVRPWVVGRHSGIHPAIVLVGTLGGLVVFGASGFVLGPLLLGLVGPVLEAWADDRER